ncbi:MAG TPA: (deoxy)nucleoside triphosphate pyrophosphohydrolase [Lacunisphaera sp.]|nr:(deoxy)nucleoside triphosphate pyrophosphohydrolase [Lacunisphaera sp.]
MTDSAPIPVVCALVVRKGRVLLAQRPLDKHLPLKWEFPGGKVEPQEDPAAAIVREIREELGCDVIITQTLPRFRHDYKTVVIEIIPFVCALIQSSSPPQPHEHIALAWVKPRELSAYDLAPADLPVLAHYLRG